MCTSDILITLVYFKNLRAPYGEKQGILFVIVFTGYLNNALLTVSLLTQLFHVIIFTEWTLTSKLCNLDMDVFVDIVYGLNLHDWKVQKVC